MTKLTKTIKELTGEDAIDMFGGDVENIVEEINNPMVSAPVELKCQCDSLAQVEQEREHLYSDEEKSGMNHKPNKCKGTNNIKKYRRGDKELYLCSCCDLFEDIKIS
mgnify:CR=1 FL=1